MRTLEKVMHDFPGVGDLPTINVRYSLAVRASAGAHSPAALNYDTEISIATQTLLYVTHKLIADRYKDGQINWLCMTFGEWLLNVEPNAEIPRILVIADDKYVSPSGGVPNREAPSRYWDLHTGQLAQLPLSVVKGVTYNITEMATRLDRQRKYEEQRNVGSSDD
jgi:hypothetical protein